jgi:NAD(P)-dependent dehydrogenase (short-subunit alcohol dehydrogenase family)
METDMPETGLKNASTRKAYIITGPTSGIGRATALELAKHGTVVLVGRDRQRLAPYLPDGANVVFVASAVEDPERKPAKAVGFRGGRYISAEASVRGEWKTGGSKQPGFDSYATSKQAILAAAMAFARETPRLHFTAVEPGLNPTTALARDGGAFVRFLSKFVIPLLVPLLLPFIKVLSTPKRAARVIIKILIDASGQTGVYYDEGGHPMQGSALVRDPKFQDRVVAETRALLSMISA